jgi:hypothetical protein
MPRSGATRHRVHRRTLQIEVLEDRRLLSGGGLLPDLTPALPPPAEPLLSISADPQPPASADLTSEQAELSAADTLTVGQEVEVELGLASSLDIGVQSETEIETQVVDAGLAAEAEVGVSTVDPGLAVTTEPTATVVATTPSANLDLGLGADDGVLEFSLESNTTVGLGATNIGQDSDADLGLGSDGLATDVAMDTAIDTPAGDVSTDLDLGANLDQNGIGGNIGIGIQGSAAGNQFLKSAVDVSAGTSKTNVIIIDADRDAHAGALVEHVGVRLELPPLGNGQVRLLLGSDHMPLTVVAAAEAAQPISFATAEEARLLILSSILTDLSALSLNESAAGAEVVSVSEAMEPSAGGAEVISELEAVLLRASDLLAGLLPFDPALLGALLARGQLGEQILDFLAELGWSPWLMAAAVALAGQEVARRRKQRARVERDDEAMLNWLAFRPMLAA